MLLHVYVFLDCAEQIKNKLARSREEVLLMPLNSLAYVSI